MATDIAFVVGAMALLGSRVPHGLKILILSLAIVDDLLAVVVIAFFYTESIHVTWLAAAALGFGILLLLGRVGVRSVAVYVFVGAAIWLATLKSGVHPTISGVLLGFLTPAKAWIGRTSLVEILDAVGRRLRSERDAETELTRKALGDLIVASRESVSPLERLELALHPWVGFVIMPVFALANAGIAVSVSSLLDSTALAVAASLAIGKPLGIVVASWLVVQLGWSSLPDRVSWPAMVGTGALGGIGFTMSLFIASLGLEGELLLAAKGGILLGSAVSAVAGFAVLAGALPRRKLEDPTGDGAG
jgi:NhaA family Na+:H+ antiporter